MHLFSSIIPLLLVSALSLASVQCTDVSLTPFGMKVDSYLNEHTKNTLFCQNYKNLEEIKETEKIVGEKFDREIGVPIDPCLEKELNEAYQRLIESHNKGALFQAYTNAFSQILKHCGKLNSHDADHFAKMYVEELNKSAMTVPSGHSILSTYPPLVVANARFLKCVGVTSQKDVNQYRKYLIQEFKNSALKKTHDWWGFLRL